MFSLGFSLTCCLKSDLGGEVSLDFLFVGAAGHWAGGYAPPAFEIPALIPVGGPAFYAGGYAPPAFDPSAIYSTATAGHWAGGYEGGN